MRKNLCFVAFILICSMGCAATQTHTAALHPSCRSAAQQLCENGLIGQLFNASCSGIAACLPAEVRLAAEAEAPSSAIIVTAGPISQPYEALGEVHVSTVGMVNLGSHMRDALFRSPFSVATAGATPTASIETMHKMLKEQARVQYGSKVDAVINVTYYTEPDGDVFASGLVVHFP